MVEALNAYGVRVEVVDGPAAVDATQELVQDMLAIVTCFAARLYGRRSQRFRPKVSEAAKEVEQLAGPTSLHHGNPYP